MNPNREAPVGADRPASEIVAELRARAAEADCQFDRSRDKSLAPTFDDGEEIGVVELAFRQRLRVTLQSRRGQLAVVLRVWTQDDAGAWYGLGSRVIAVTPWRMAAFARLVADALERVTARAADRPTRFSGRREP